MSERSSSKKTSLSGFSAFSWSTDLRAKTSSSVSGRGAGAGAGAGGGAGGGGGAGAVGVGGGGCGNRRGGRTLLRAASRRDRQCRTKRERRNESTNANHRVLLGGAAYRQ